MTNSKTVDLDFIQLREEERQQNQESIVGNNPDKPATKRLDALDRNVRHIVFQARA